MNTIALRIYDFLKDYPPFDFLKRGELLDLCTKIVVKYIELNKEVFHEGDAPQPYFYIVREGAIQLQRALDGKTVFHNLCDEGEIFGIRQMFGEDRYRFSSVAVEDTLLYAIPIAEMKPWLERYPKVTLFLANTFAVNVQESDKSLAAFPVYHPFRASQSDIHLSALLTLNNIRKAVICKPSDRITFAAGLMTQNNVSSIVVADEAGRPLGVLSDSTIRKRIARGKFSLDDVARQIMTSPPACAMPGLTLADIQILMIRYKVRYLCVTEDGTPESALLGIVTEHDLMIAHGNNPAVILREIQNARYTFELKAITDRSEDLLRNYLEKEVAVDYVANIFGDLHDALFVRAIQMAMDEARFENPPSSPTLNKPPGLPEDFKPGSEAELIVSPDENPGDYEFEAGVDGLIGDGPGPPKPPDFCWLALGSAGRREQLLRTDQDSALIYEDGAEDAENVKSYFLQLAQKATSTLNDVGFAFCKGNMMASNPVYCLSLSEWKALFASWIESPNPQSLLNGKIFFDFRPVFGKAALAEELRQSNFKHIRESPVFLSFLAQDSTAAQPPLGFFRNFILESGGEHKNQLNLKNRAMVLIADSVRALALGAQISEVGTLGRLHFLIEAEPHNKELYLEIVESYQTLMRFRALNGLKRGDSGKYIDPSELNKMDRLILKQSFKPISALQQIVKIRFGAATIS